MALGKHPNRTVIVALGPVRSFTDVTGRHILHLSNQPASRYGLADRLRTAGCDVITTGRRDWLQACDFDAAYHDPDAAVGAAKPPLQVVKREANYNPEAKHKRKVWIYLRNTTDRCLEIRHPS